MFPAKIGCVIIISPDLHYSYANIKAWSIIKNCRNDQTITISVSMCNYLQARDIYIRSCLRPFFNVAQVLLFIAAIYKRISGTHIGSNRTEIRSFNQGR